MAILTHYDLSVLLHGLHARTTMFSISLHLVMAVILVSRSLSCLVISFSGYVQTRFDFKKKLPRHNPFLESFYVIAGLGGVGCRSSFRWPPLIVLNQNFIVYYPQ